MSIKVLGKGLGNWMGSQLIINAFQNEQTDLTFLVSYYQVLLNPLNIFSTLFLTTNVGQLLWVNWKGLFSSCQETAAFLHYAGHYVLRSSFLIFLWGFKNIGCCDLVVPWGEERKSRRLSEVLFHFNLPGKIWIWKCCLLPNAQLFLSNLNVFILSEWADLKWWFLFGIFPCKIMLSWFSVL